MVLSSNHEECIFYFSLNMVRTLQTMVIFYSMVYIIAYIYSNVMEFTWNPFGIQWNGGGINIIIPCGIQMDIPDGMMESRWNLAILCGFHVEYRWNRITKKSGIPAKIYSIWNEWNPSGIRWIPLGFHMDSMWNT